MTSFNAQNQYSVSVVIPAYNSGKYIQRAIESVLAQTLKPDEIFVVDDNSTDDTAKIVRQFDSVRYIHQAHAGASVARNIGIEAATSEWIAFLDADDEWLPEYLHKQIELLKNNPDLAWTTTNFYRCLCDEKLIGPDVPIELMQKALGSEEFFDDYFKTPFCRGCGWTGTMLIKKSILQEAGLFRPGQLMANDLDLWYRIAYRWPRIGFISQPLATYHMVIPQSISDKHKQTEHLVEFTKRHLELSAEFGRDDAYKSFAEHAVTSWIRGLIFENKPADIRRLLEEFGELLTFRFKAIIRLLLIWPGTTAMICHFISRIVRALNLRKTIMRRPRRS